MTKPAISILTPTYNRAHVLHRAYDSLKRQKGSDFEWVVVDDGSTDDTPMLLARWQAEADFPITLYRYEKNRRRNAAVNSGAKFASGDYSVILDSDDALLDDALETIAYWRERTGIDAIPNVFQLVFRCVDEVGALVGTLEEGGGTGLPQETIRMSDREARYRLGLTFECIGLMKSDICRSRRFLELDNSEHSPEIITHMEIAKRYETIYVDRPIRRYLMNDGVERLSDEAASGIKWPRGNYSRALATLNDDIDYFWQRPKLFLNAARKITRLGAHIGRPSLLQLRDLANGRARLLWIACVPVGLTGYCRDRLHGIRAPVADFNISAWGPAQPPEYPVFHAPPERFGSAPMKAAVREAVPE